MLAPSSPGAAYRPKTPMAEAKPRARRGRGTVQNGASCREAASTVIPGQRLFRLVSQSADVDWELRGRRFKSGQPDQRNPRMSGGSFSCGDLTIRRRMVAIWLPFGCHSCPDFSRGGALLLGWASKGNVLRFRLMDQPIVAQSLCGRTSASNMISSSVPAVVWP